MNPMDFPPFYKRDNLCNSLLAFLQPSLCYNGFYHIYEGESISNQPIPFPMDRDGHDFHALFQYMIYTRVQNNMRIESFFNKILNVKHG